MSNCYIASLISGLGVVSSPSTIARLVVAIDINSIKAESIWAYAHVCEELRKGRTPCIAHRYASTAIMLKTGHIRVIAPTLCMLPSSIFMGLAHAVKSALNAATAFCSTFSKTPTPHFAAIAAITNAVPAGLAIHVVSASNDDKSSESPSRKVYKFAGMSDRFALSHDASDALGLEPQRCYQHQSGSLSLA